MHPASAEDLIDEEDFDRDERLPYRAELWPSAIALARHVAGLDLADGRAIELGCGVGLPPLAALARGARVLATDHYAAALDFSRYNARANTGREPETALLDWQPPRTQGLGIFDLVLAADVLYEERNVPALASLIPALLAPGGEVLFADPRRRSAPVFLAAMEKRGFGRRSESAVVRQGDREVTVALHRLRRVDP